MSINVGEVSTNLSDGERFYAYSGDIQGGVGLPATITLISIPNTGLRDSFVKIQPYFAMPITTASASQLGIQISIDGTSIYNDQLNNSLNVGKEEFELFIPRQSNLTILSLNTAGNNTQIRGVNVLGWRL